MSANTSIQWTNRTWNPVRGCALVSDGCRNCYAMKQAHRFSGAGQPYEGLTELGPAGPRWTGKIRVVHEAMDQPLRWREPLRIFVNSMSDLFHEDVDVDDIAHVFAVMAFAHWHQFQILTKRPARMQQVLSDPDFRDQVDTWMSMMLDDEDRPPSLAWDAEARLTTDARATAPDVVSDDDAWPLPNVWLGVSCESQKAAEERVPWLLGTPAVIRFISAEPLLSPINLRDLEVVAADEHRPRVSYDALTGHVKGPDEYRPERIHWVIPGGESGSTPRPCEIAWIRSLVQQCDDAGTACFVKQLGSDARGLCDWEHHDEHPPVLLDKDGCDTTVGRAPFTLQHAVGDAFWPCQLKTKDRKGGDPLEWPVDLRVRQFPVTHREAV